MPIFSADRTTVRQAIGGGLGIMHGPFAVTEASGGTAPLVNSIALPFRNNDQVLGMSLYVASGGGSGQERVVTTATVIGVPSGMGLRIDRAWTTVPSTNGTFELWERVTPGRVNSFINDAIRGASRRVLEHKVDYSVQLLDLLMHWGSFERWPDGTTSAPDGWTLTGSGGTVTRNAVVKYAGRYSAAVAAALNTATFLESDDIPEWPKFAGNIVTVRAKVYTTTSGRVRVQILDGVNTFSSGYHDGLGGWDGNAGAPIIINGVTLSNALTQLRVRLTTDSGAALTVYWGKVWVDTGTRSTSSSYPSPAPRRRLSPTSPRCGWRVRAWTACSTCGCPPRTTTWTGTPAHGGSCSNVAR